MPEALRRVGVLYGLVWSSAGECRLRYVVGLVLQALGYLCSLATPLLLGLAVNAAQASGAWDIDTVVFWLALIPAFVLLSWAFNAPGRIIERQVAVEVHRHSVDRLLGRALDVPVRWHQNRHSGDTLHRITVTVDAVTAFCESQSFYIKSICTFLGASTAMLLLSWPVGVAALVSFGVLGLVMAAMDGGLRARLDRRIGAVARLSGILTDVLGNIATIVTLSAGSAARRNVQGALAEVADAGRRIIVPMERKWWLITYGSGVLNGVLLVAFATLDWVHTGSVRIGFLVTISGYAAALHNSIEVMGGHWQSLLQLQAEAHSADELATADLAEVHDNGLPDDWEQLTVDVLELRHPPREDSDEPGAAISGTFLHLWRGERVALVGASGAGKSSLLRALAGVLPCERFAVSIDGRSAYAARSLSGIAGLVPQETEIFADTVRINIDLGTGADDLRIERAVSNARLTEVVAGLPDGLDTNLAERGIDLSGGERQRLGLARGLLMTDRCSLLLLDEPTSNLDPVTEAEVVENVMAARSDATIVAAVHRLRLLALFDTVVFMQDGAVVDAGTCDALAERQPAFRELLNSAVVGDIPLDEVPVGEARTHEAPVDEAPVVEAPVDEEAPVEEAPVAPAIAA